MERIIDVADFIYKKYKEVSGGENLDEMKLHKLLYFAQRECLALTGEMLFEEHFEGWIYGPVSPEIRKSYYPKDGILESTNEVSAETAYILNNIIEEYGKLTSWKLSKLSHDEISWNNARKGLEDWERGSKPLTIEDIKEDSKKVRLFDHTWGMYYDEFEDIPFDKAVSE